MKNPAKCCGTCFWWKKQTTKKPIVGNCKEAISRARLTVPFAINLTVGMTCFYGGRDCPTYQALPKKEVNIE